jgi:ribulose 1,5-bisphosphate synthetase/thiazole synthase
LIIRKNVTTLNHVYLVVKGSTSASILGRYLSSHSVSSNPRKSGNKPGGDTGRWIGEMVFLDRLWEKEQERILKSQIAKAERQENENPIIQPVEAATTKASRLLNAGGEAEDSPTAIYTIVAMEDCIIWRWSFDDMEKLMSSSTVCLLSTSCLYLNHHPTF